MKPFLSEPHSKKDLGGARVTVTTKGTLLAFGSEVLRSEDYGEHWNGRIDYARFNQYRVCSGSS